MISMPPPASGGIALAQLLHAVSESDFNKILYQSADYIHLIVEAERRVYADRATYLGDADFVHVPVNNLINKTYNLERMQNFSPNRASLSDSIEAENPAAHEIEETTHYSIVDRHDNAVSATTTI